MSGETWITLGTLLLGFLGIIIGGVRRFDRVESMTREQNIRFDNQDKMLSRIDINQEKHELHDDSRFDRAAADAKETRHKTANALQSIEGLRERVTALDNDEKRQLLAATASLRTATDRLDAQERERRRRSETPEPRRYGPERDKPPGSDR